MRGTSLVKLALAALMVATPLVAASAVCASGGATAAHAAFCARGCCCGCETPARCTCTVGEPSDAPQPAVPPAPKPAHDGATATPAVLAVADPVVLPAGAFADPLRSGTGFSPGDVHLDLCALRC